ncbi:MAG: hypothetical protein JO297_09345 [Nitrososphaeraceae archaeon]|nr:hypothetical protein [Nitrososphaeraceae archaeon]
MINQNQHIDLCHSIRKKSPCYVIIGQKKVKTNNDGGGSLRTLYYCNLHPNSLQNGDTKTTLVHLNLIQQQTQNNTSTSAPSLTNASNQVVIKPVSKISKQMLSSSINDKIDRTDEIIKALVWISKNTPRNSVFASWWDYGDWIRDVSNRTSLAGSTVVEKNQTRIETIAKMFIDKPYEGIRIARQLKANYILIYIVAQRFAGTNGSYFYTLGSGGDESKKQWFMRIGGFNESDYLEKDGITPNQRFWNATLLGQLIPFKVAGYGLGGNIQQDYSPGSIAIYSKDVKYPNNIGRNEPLNLVYSSDSFNGKALGEVPIIFIYKVNGAP